MSYVRGGMEFSIFIFIGFAALAIFGAIHAHKKAKERTAALAAWAASKGMGFQGEKVRDFDDYHPELRCLRSGSNRYAYNIASGQWDNYYVTAFDYHYETHSTDSKGNRQTHHHYFSAILLKPEHIIKPLVIHSSGSSATSTASSACATTAASRGPASIPNSNAATTSSPTSSRPCRPTPSTRRPCSTPSPKPAPPPPALTLRQRARRATRTSSSSR